MAVKKILLMPKSEDVLTTRAVPVTLDDPQLSKIVTDLKDTIMATDNAVGLAAPQIGYLKRVFVLRRDYIQQDIDPASEIAGSDEPVLVFINPKIISEKGQLFQEEGCLSVPDEYIKIKRSRVVKVKAFDESKQQFHVRLENLGSRAVQQEIDHLNGVLIIDHQ